MAQAGRFAVVCPGSRRRSGAGTRRDTPSHSRTLRAAWSHPWRTLRSPWTSAEGLMKILSDTNAEIRSWDTFGFTGVPCLITFHFIVCHRFCVFTKARCRPTPCPARLLAPFSQKHLLTQCLCVTVWSFSQYVKQRLYYSVCRSDQRSVIRTRWKLRRWSAFSQQ